jgi:hypothetical protein
MQALCGRMRFDLMKKYPVIKKTALREFSAAFREGS